MLALLHLLAGIFLSMLLVKSAEKMISSSSKLARHFGISEYTVSFFVIAVATSLPEFVVGVVSALNNNSVLSFGNVIGSNIADLTIILAIPIFVGGAIKTKELIKNKDLTYAAFFGVLPFILMFDKILSKIDGALLVLSYVFYLILVLKRSSSFENFVEKFHKTSVIKNILLFVVSALLLLVSSSLLVKTAEILSISVGVPMIFLGLTLTALGTSLPELAFGLKAIRAHHKGEVLGNVVGSVIANSTLVLGVTALINPISNVGLSISSSVFLLLTLALFVIFGFREKIGKLEGAILIVFYLLFLITEGVLI